MLNNFWIGLYFFLGIMGVAIIIFLILSLIQQQKIKQFKKKSQEIEMAIKDNILTLSNPLLPININYELPKDEKCYYQSKIIGDEITDKKEIKRYNFYLHQKMKEKYRLENLPGHLNLHSKSQRDIFTGECYLTNYRIVIQTKDNNLIFWLDQINFALPSVFNINGEYQNGFFISTNKKIYRFITNDVKISMIIFKNLFNKEK